MHVTHRYLTLLALIVPSTLSGCDVPCSVEIVQADVTRSAVRVRNTCEGEIDSSPLMLCSGPTYSDDCTPFPQTMKAGECVEFPVWDLPQEYKGAFGVGIFQAGKNPEVTPPIDNLIIGDQNTALADPDGVIRKPDALSITFGYSLTLARYGWWYPIPSTPQPISCFTWAHTIKVSEESPCNPQLVEVHPGDGSAYLKLSLRPYCDDIDTADLRIGYGVSDVEATLPLPGSRCHLDDVAGDDAAAQVPGDGAAVGARGREVHPRPRGALAGGVSEHDRVIPEIEQRAARPIGVWRTGGEGGQHEGEGEPGHGAVDGDRRAGILPRPRSTQRTPSTGASSGRACAATRPRGRGPTNAASTSAATPTDRQRPSGARSCACSRPRTERTLITRGDSSRSCAPPSVWTPTRRSSRRIRPRSLTS